MPAVDANGITIEYDTTGAGDPLLLVMGLGGQLTDWHPDFVAELASAGFQVITFDNRDQGLSTEFDWQPPSQVSATLSTLVKRPPASEYLLSDMAADAVGLLDAIGIDSAHVVGMSMGGMISQTIAIEHPQRVRSLTSIMSNTGDRKNGMIAKKLMAKMARLKPAVTVDEGIDRAVTIFGYISGTEFDADATRERATTSLNRSFRPQGTERQTAAIMASPDRTEGLTGVTAPTLVIHGMLDPLVKPSGGVATAAAVPGSRLVMYPEMGHDLPSTRWTEMIGEIRRNADRA